MPSTLQRVKSTWDRFVRGRRFGLAAVPANFDYPRPDETLMSFLAVLFTANDAQVRRSGSWIVVNGGRLFVRAAHFNLRQQDSLILQVDFVCITAAGDHITESFAGIGTDVKSALVDACKSFQDSSFHALFATLVDPSCDQVDRDTWCIGGIQRAMIFGWLRMRGTLPLDLWPPVFESIRKQVEASSIPQGLHWVRYFYAHFPGSDPTIEVLLNNKPWDSLMAQSTKLPWPTADGFYSARLFFTIQDKSVPMNGNSRAGSASLQPGS